MNHLAHCYLSFGQSDWLIGNFMGDYVKGNDWQELPSGIRTGVLIHRQIDSFTDSHPQIKAGVHRIRPFASRYAAPIYDILCDHLLTRNWSNLVTGQSLDQFATNTYAVLLERKSDLPPDLQNRVPRMVEGDFLRGYGHPDHLLWVFNRFGQRLAHPVDWPALLDFFMSEIHTFQAEFDVFFPEMEAQLKQKFLHT